MVIIAHFPFSWLALVSPLSIWHGGGARGKASGGRFLPFPPSYVVAAAATEEDSRRLFCMQQAPLNCCSLAIACALLHIFCSEFGGKPLEAECCLFPSQGLSMKTWWQKKTRNFLKVIFCKSFPLEKNSTEFLQLQSIYMNTLLLADTTTFPKSTMPFGQGKPA